MYLYDRLNTVREMCVRCPLAMTSELLQDLAAYKSFRDKGVMMAARSVIQLFRRTNPELLQRKDRVRELADCAIDCCNSMYGHGSLHIVWWMHSGLCMLSFCGKCVYSCYCVYMYHVCVV